MSKRIIFSVVHSPKGGWDLNRGTRKMSHHTTKENAVQRGIRAARKKDLSQLRIHKENGRIQEERTYGNDPEKYPG